MFANCNKFLVSEPKGSSRGTKNVPRKVRTILIHLELMCADAQFLQCQNWVYNSKSIIAPRTPTIYPNNLKRHPTT